MNINPVKAVSVVLLILLVSTAGAAQFKIRNCESSAMLDLNWAVDYIDNNLNAILDDATFIPSKQKDRIKRKWPKTTIKCSPNRKSCRDGSLAFQSTANIVHICWDNIRPWGALMTRCNLVAIILHEKAHEAHVPKSAQHNDRHGYAFEVDDDPVYRFEEVALAHCNNAATAALSTAPGSFNAQGLMGVESGAPRRLSVGARCSNNAQCISGQCRRKICVCTEDTDCGPNQRCKTAGKNYCVPTGGLIGEICKKNEDCAVGECERGICVCDTDSDCQTTYGSPDFRCRKLGKNYCQETNQPVGGACSKNSDCQPGLKCKKDRCT